MMSKTTQTAQKDIITEQHELSILLLQLLYKIYKKIYLDIDSDEPPAVTAYYKLNDLLLQQQKNLPEKIRLYDIWRETYSDTDHYWLRVQDGNRRLIEFGRANNDGTFFNNNEYNYLAALYDLRTRSHNTKQPVKPTLSAKTRLTLADLESQKAKPNLENFEAWDEKRINVLLYLKQVLTL